MLTPVFLSFCLFWVITRHGLYTRTRRNYSLVWEIIFCCFFYRNVVIAALCMFTGVWICSGFKKRPNKKSSWSLEDFYGPSETGLITWRQTHYSISSRLRSPAIKSHVYFPEGTVYSAEMIDTIFLIIQLSSFNPVCGVSRKNAKW